FANYEGARAVGAGDIFGKAARSRRESVPRQASVSRVDERWKTLARFAARLGWQSFLLSAKYPSKRCRDPLKLRAARGAPCVAASDHRSRRHERKRRRDRSVAAARDGMRTRARGIAR